MYDAITHEPDFHQYLIAAAVPDSLEIHAFGGTRLSRATA